MILFHHPATHPQNTPIPLFIAYWRLLVVFDIWCWGGYLNDLTSIRVGYHTLVYLLIPVNLAIFVLVKREKW